MKLSEWKSADHSWLTLKSLAIHSLSSFPRNVQRLAKSVSTFRDNQRCFMVIKFGARCNGLPLRVFRLTSFSLRTLCSTEFSILFQKPFLSWVRPDELHQIQTLFLIQVQHWLTTWTESRAHLKQTEKLYWFWRPVDRQ